MRSPGVTLNSGPCSAINGRDVCRNRFQKATSQQTVRISDHCFWQKFYGAAMHPGISVQKKCGSHVVRLPSTG